MMVLRLPFAGSVGAIATAALFYLLWGLVDAGPTPYTRTSVDIVRFKPLLTDSRVEPKPPRPLKPAREEAPSVPGVPTMELAERGTLPATPTGITGPTRNIGDIAPVGSGFDANGIDGDATPLVRVLPQYPPSAVIRDIEGWVRVRFTVTANGSVTDVSVVAAEPENVFDNAALAAVARWRYEPRVVGGVPVERVGFETIVRFELPD